MASLSELAKPPCTRNPSHSYAVATIPMPDLIPGEHRNIHVCRDCAQRAIGQCYYVVFYEEPESAARNRHDALVKAKHQNLRTGFHRRPEAA